MTGEGLLKKFDRQKTALIENLLKIDVLEQNKKEILDFLEENLKEGSLLRLRFEKLKTNIKLQGLWSNPNGYPMGDMESYFQPWITLVEQYIAEKTIKTRLVEEGLFIETRSQAADGDLTILVGKKDGSGGKAHIFIDSKTAEIRVEDNQTAPEEVIDKIETVLTLQDGRKIKTARGLIEKMEPKAESGSITEPKIKIVLKKLSQNLNRTNYEGEVVFIDGTPDGYVLKLDILNQGCKNTIINITLTLNSKQYILEHFEKIKLDIGDIETKHLYFHENKHHLLEEGVFEIKVTDVFDNHYIITGDFPIGKAE